MYLTKQGLDDLKKEYNELLNTKRPAIVARLSEARDQGDLSENAEYIAAKEELAFIDGRIEELELLLKQVVLIDDSNHTSNMVELGSQVTVKINSREAVFHVVGEWEADPEQKKISHESPLGKALLGKTVGDEVAVEAPAGTVMYRVVSIG